MNNNKTRYKKHLEVYKTALLIWQTKYYLKRHKKNEIE